MSAYTPWIIYLIFWIGGIILGHPLIGMSIGVIFMISGFWIFCRVHKINPFNFK